MNSWQALILAVVEGLTEYLPVSSTGHIILTSAIMGIEGESFVKDYTVMVQFGAILSVLVVYWRRFFQSQEFYLKLAVGFLPAAVIGLLVKNHIDALLGSVLVVAWALVVGGFVLLFVDRWFREPAVEGDLTLKKAFAVGVIQCLAFVPGVSRAAATIVGGLSQGLSRKSAAEFSFFLAVPTLTGAGAIKLLKIVPTISPDQWWILFIGNVVSFFVGWLTIRVFVGYLTRHGFWIFGWYRILVGGILLLINA